MALKNIVKLPASIFGQMTLLTIFFIIACIYFFMVSPVLDRDVRFDASTPIEKTQELVRTALRNYIDSLVAKKDKSVPIDNDQVLKKVKELNPGFRYYLYEGDTVFSSPGYTPRFYHLLHIDELDAVNKKVAMANNCSSLFQSVSDSDGSAGYVQYSSCGNSSYYLEFIGIKVPLTIDPPNPLTVYFKVLLSNSSNFLYSALGVFLIVSLILVLNIRLLKKLADVAASFDPNKLDQKLPEKGLPKEVLPLVQAVNQMIAKVDATQKEHNFFLSTAAHEMRTPLTVLRTRLELMDDSEIKDKLINDVRRLTGLVNQLLKLMQAGGPRSLDKTFDLADSCQRVVQSVAAHAEQQGVKVTLDDLAGSHAMKGDRGLVEVAITNLVDNAVSFSEPGAEVQLCLARDGTVTVRDFGPGIAPENLDSLFSPFAKFPPNRNGHGLGLAIVEAIVRLHGGQVSVINADGGGALFTVRWS